MDEGHVYVAASGFGLRVIPKAAPYKYALAATLPHLDVERLADQSWLFARVIPRDGGYESKIADNTAALADVLDVVEGPALDRWWLETSVYRVPLPVGWIAHSTNSPSMFDLMGPDGSIIFVQTPPRVAALSDVRTPDQEVVSGGSDSRSEWIDLSYVYGGERWRQRHQLRHVGRVNVLITAQARVDAMHSAVATQTSLIEAVYVRGA